MENTARIIFPLIITLWNRNYILFWKTPSVVFSWQNHKSKFHISGIHKFSNLDSYYRSYMIRKSSMNRSVDLLDDYTAQQVSAVLATDRILPTNRNSGKILARRKSASAWIFDRELFVNNSMDKICSLKKGKLLQVFKDVIILYK